MRKRHAANPADGVRIAYEVVGDGPPLVLFHGTAMSGAMWRAFGYVGALGGERRLVILDARGHGDSDAPRAPDAYAMELLVGDVRAVLDDLGIERTDYLGYSFGGRVGFALAASAPDRLRVLALGGASHRPQRGVLDRVIYPGFADTLEQRGTEAFLDEWGERLGLEIPDALRDLVRPNDPSALAAFARRTDAEPGVADGELARVELPVLLFAGERDEERLGDSRAAAELLPRAELHVVPGTDHVGTLAHADAVVPLVRDFLARAG